ncbi:conserved putative membrane protein [Tokyovirus A1]|uniref:conserved putative membrane protein, partial n=1 Tax=Tokyovirus A1 TaxID=1826170 RepID=UPI0007A970E5|nr:conserved putative membrane protein [Tokyovirus A1]BAU80039.1 conserved putative membrane protein [Tokyovirus A1]
MSTLLALRVFLSINKDYGTQLFGEETSVLLGYFLVFSWPFVMNLCRLRQTGNYKAFEVVTWMSLVFWLSSYVSLFRQKGQLFDILAREKEEITLVNQELSVVWDFPLDGFTLNWGCFFLFLVFPAFFEERGVTKFVFLVLDALLGAKIPLKISDMPVMLSPGILPLLMYVI